MLFEVTSIFQSNMILQRNKPTTIWGWGAEEMSVSAKASWDNCFYTTKIKNDCWSITIPPTEYDCLMQSITISNDNNESIIFENLLFGDVWICAGQSNMFMPIGKLDDSFGGFHGVENYESEIDSAHFPKMRLLTIPPASSNTEQANVLNQCEWLMCDPSNAWKFSAVAYYFGKKLYLETGIPIGLIVSAVSNSRCEEWAPAWAIENDKIAGAYYKKQNKSSQLYNAMIYPLRNLAITGFIWYQGESNIDDKPITNYTIISCVLIRSWRHIFKQAKLPFLFVQIPPYSRTYLGVHNEDNFSYDIAMFREAQTAIRDNLNYVGMAILMDQNDLVNIHSIFKKVVGERLALLALFNNYNNQI